jgi:hypothetical protein
MSTRQPLVIATTGIVRAPAERVYGILSDYRNGHPRILPPQFRELTVEQGGVGAGTVIRFQVRIAGRTQTCRAAITEPRPGRVLVETDLGTNGAVTTFTVNPAERADWSEVGISTRIDTRPGILGAIERFIANRALRPIYRQELEILDRVASSRA